MRRRDIYRKRYLRLCAGASPDAETLHIHQTVRQQYCGSISENGQGGREIDTFSIDVVEKQIIEDILDAFHIQPRNIYTRPLLAGVAEEEYVAWHRSCWRRR
ncbi:MAG: hypothetical protein ACLTW9_12815 [Enterocloster sp.]